MVVSLPFAICRKLLTYIIPLKTQACYYFVVKQSKWYSGLQPQGRKNVSRRRFTLLNSLVSRALSNKCSRQTRTHYLIRPLSLIRFQLRFVCLFVFFLTFRPKIYNSPLRCVPSGPKPANTQGPNPQMLL